MVYDDLLTRSPSLSSTIDAGKGPDNFLMVEVFLESLSSRDMIDEPQYTVRTRDMIDEPPQYTVRTRDMIDGVHCSTFVDVDAVLGIYVLLIASIGAYMCTCRFLHLGQNWVECLACFSAFHF
jgi:hypothetical protein